MAIFSCNHLEYQSLLQRKSLEGKQSCGRAVPPSGGTLNIKAGHSAVDAGSVAWGFITFPTHFKVPVMLILNVSFRVSLCELNIVLLLCFFFFSEEFSLFSYNNGMVMSSCRELDNNRSALSAASAFAIATAGANEGTPTKEKYRRMSLASTGTYTPTYCPLLIRRFVRLLAKYVSVHRQIFILLHVAEDVSVISVYFLQVSQQIRETVTKSL